MMLSWGKACSTVPSGPLPPPPPLTYQLGRIQGGGGNGAIAPPPHIPPPPLTVKSLFETTILWHMFLKINISQIFLSKVCDFIYLELEKLNLTPTPLIWILNLLALQPIPPPLSINGLAQGQWGGGWLVGWGWRAPPPPPPTWILYPPLPIKTPIRWFFLSRCKEQFDMTCLGTIQANRKGLPKDFTAVNNRPVGDYQVLYDEASHVSIHSEIFKNKSGKGISSFFRVFEKPLCSCDDGYFSFEKQRLPFWIL